MALIRSRRELGVPLQLATPPVVGPGSYASDHSHSTLLTQPPTAAPFSTSASRSASSHLAPSALAASDSTPGPGSYRPVLAASHYQRPDVPLAAFASAVDRFAVRRDSSPGPDAYHVPSHLSTTGALTFTPLPSASASHTSLSASHRAQTAPSIPSAHTSHGYSSENGRLVAQPPPQCDADASPSPAAYNPIERLLRPSVTGGGNAVQYGRNTQPRFSAPSTAHTTPGPGKYDPYHTASAAPLAQPAATAAPSTSSFLATGRSHERPNTNPGVGTYQLRAVNGGSTGYSSGHSAAPFGVSSGRSSLVDKQRLGTPGPTTYDARADEWARAGGGSGSSRAEWTSDDTAPSAFRSSTARFPAHAADARAIAYAGLLDYRLERAKTSFSHVRSFGSVQPRFAAAAAATDHADIIAGGGSGGRQSAAGPASYRVRTSSFKGNKMPSAAFHSETRRFSPLAKDDAKTQQASSGGGHADGPYGAVPSAAFASHSARFDGGIGATAGLGPGAYHDGIRQVEEGEKFGGRAGRSRGANSAFVSGSRRWSVEGRTGAPAPGQYAQDRSSDGLNKRSFNVTIC